MQIKKPWRRLSYLLLEPFRTIHLTLVRYWLVELQNRPLTLPNGSLMVFSPHQDDEVFGCGGAIALKCEQNIPVRVVFMTDGQAFDEGRNPNQQAKVDCRNSEAISALATLGLASTEIDFLGFPDGELQNFSEEQRQAAIARIAGLLKTYQPQIVYVPHALDAHPDHEATYTLVKAAISLLDDTSQAIEIWQYPIWLFWSRVLWGNLNPNSVCRPYSLDIRAVQAKKEAAIAMYKSQQQVLPAAFLKQFYLPYEIYFKDNLETDVA